MRASIFATAAAALLASAAPAFAAVHPEDRSIEAGMQTSMLFWSAHDVVLIGLLADGDVGPTGSGAEGKGAFDPPDRPAGDVSNSY